ncbi:CDP-diacylglycerol--glycerol-3-phosphate 3-phosphatidyltransferase [Candidatus Woesearchaeota archaeon]|nr:MAG: CDP-diacylglycerol--glycerol-3-phosphate 3-phosphatidyltransferase [Candidatus Woesearchaeota archaeon]
MNLPNKISILRIMLIPVFVLLFYFLQIPSQKFILAGLFAFMALTDALDGHIARKTKQVTELGAVLDPIADKLISIAVIILYIGNGIPAWMALIMLSRDMILLGLRSFATEYKIIIRVSVLGKIKTGIEMVSFILIILQLTIGTWILGVAMILSVISGVDYCIKGITKLKKHYKKMA